MGRLEPRHFSLIIEILAVSFVVFQVVKERVFKNKTPFEPGYGTGTAVGIGARLIPAPLHTGRSHWLIFF